MSAKRFSWLICSLVVLSVLVTACGPQATPCPECPPCPEAGECPPCPECPECPEAPAAAERLCTGVKIVFFPGGPPGGPFATVVYNGAVAAAADLDADVEYMFSDWNTEKICMSPATCWARRLSGGLASDPEIGPWSGGFCPSQPVA
jgi:ABC-type sugar transport system substrate-binding protein